MKPRTKPPAEPRPTDPANTRFPDLVDTALRQAGWQPGRWNIRGAEQWADTLRAHVSPAGHRHCVFPAAVEAWAEFGGLRITGPPPGRQHAPTPVRLDPLAGLHLARTLADLGRALETDIAPLGEESDSQALLAIDAQGRIYTIDHTGDWYLGEDIDQGLTTVITGLQPTRLGLN